jgi:Beta-xylosidase
MFTKIKLISALLLFVFLTNVKAQQKLSSSTGGAMDDNTFCNPLNLDYRFSTAGASYREAADPMVVLFNGDYYIFASKSGGYWWSPDFRNWTFVKPTGIDIEKYAPSVWVIGNTMYYTSSESGDIYKTTNPKGGVWSYVSHPRNWNDPWVFVDDDGRVYAYYGCDENGSINCVELDPNNKFAVISEEVKCIYSDPTNHGFEVNGDNNESGLPWTEGASMLKYNGKYYLTYSTPGTQCRSYCEGYYTSDSPMGPYTFGANSPQTHKPLGYVTGTGHGGLFHDKAGKLWSITCVVLANKHWFERRLAVFPAEIDENGSLRVNTLMGDYPQYYPDVTVGSVSNNTTEWNLLSKGKTVRVSSTYSTYVAANAADENIRTYWSASSGNAGEWLSVDLGKNCTINAVQSNFYEAETTFMGGRTASFTTKYKVEYSTDNSTWTVMYDKSASTKDTPHDYVQLTIPVTARYVRITNMGDVAGAGYFALSDFRVFGSNGGTAPAAVSTAHVLRWEDLRCANVSWKAVDGADGYIIRYGIAPDKLWNNYQVWSGTSYSLRSLVIGQTYYFRVDSYNGSGVTEGKEVMTSASVVSNLDPYFPNEAEDFNQQTGTLTEGCSDTGGGSNIGFIDNGDWLKFSNVDLAKGASSFSARVASAGSGGSIELHLDSVTGAKIGTCPVAVTGGWQTWVTKSCSVSGATGVHDLYLKFVGNTGALFNLNWWQFVATASAVTNVNDQSPIAVISLNGGNYLKGTQPGDVVTIYNCQGQLLLTLKATSDLEQIQQVRGLAIIKVKSATQNTTLKAILK